MASGRRRHPAHPWRDGGAAAGPARGDPRRRHGGHRVAKLLQPLSRCWPASACKALEIPHPSRSTAWRWMPSSCCWRRGACRPVVAMPTVHNPLGCSMPLATKRRLAELANRHRVPLIEDALLRRAAVRQAAAADGQGLRQRRLGDGLRATPRPWRLATASAGWRRGASADAVRQLKFCSTVAESLLLGETVGRCSSRAAATTTTCASCAGAMPPRWMRCAGIARHFPAGTGRPAGRRLPAVAGAAGVGRQSARCSTPRWPSASSSFPACCIPPGRATGTVCGCPAAIRWTSGPARRCAGSASWPVRWPAAARRTEGAGRGAGGGAAGRGGSGCLCRRVAAWCGFSRRRLRPAPLPGAPAVRRGTPGSRRGRTSPRPAR